MLAAAQNNVRIRKWSAVALSFVVRPAAAQARPQHNSASVPRGGDPEMTAPGTSRSVFESALGLKQASEKKG
jgi:hypothetical protein